MPKRTKADLLKVHGITRDQLNAAATKGVNIWSDADLAAHLKTLGSRIAKDAKISKPVAPPDIPFAESPEQTVAEIERLILASEVHDDIKIYKTKLEALKIAANVRELTGDLVPVGQVKASITRVCSAARAELLKLSSDLPPRLEGLPASTMSALIRSSITDILTRLSDETGNLYD
jgi:hypothetical protein